MRLTVLVFAALLSLPTLAFAQRISPSGGGVTGLTDNGCATVNRVLAMHASTASTAKCGSLTDDGTLITTTTATGLGLGTATPLTQGTELFTAAAQVVATGTAAVLVSGTTSADWVLFDSNATANQRRFRGRATGTTASLGRVSDDGTTAVDYLTAALATDVVTLGSAAVAGVSYISGTGDHTFSDGNVLAPHSTNINTYRFTDSLGEGIGARTNNALQLIATTKVEVLSGYLQLRNSAFYSWAATGDSGAATDTTLSRNAAGIVQVGTTVANALGTIKAAAFNLTVNFGMTTAPTVTGFCTAPSVVNNNGTAAFTVGVGTSCTGISTGTITLPAATTAWVCQAQNVTTPASFIIGQTGGTTTTATITNYSRTTGIATDWNASDVHRVSCMAY